MEKKEYTDKEPTIVACTIGPYPKSLFDKMPSVSVTFDNGISKVLFEFYPDEIQFGQAEFIGLTEAQARQLKFNKDKRYLQS
jgi:hypothetical protein